MSWRRGNVPKRKQWVRFRVTILDRDSWRCQCRGCVRHGEGVCLKAGDLEVDHINGHGGGVFEASNCQTLCKSCHIAKSALERTKPNPEREAWTKFLADTYPNKV